MGIAANSAEGLTEYRLRRAGGILPIEIGWIDEDGGARGCQSWGKHGADRNLQVLYQRRAPHRARHECRTSILPMSAFVYARSATRRSQGWRLAACFFARVAAAR